MANQDPMVTLGVDLAAQPEKTGVCRIQWDGGSVCVEDLFVGADDDRLHELFGKADSPAAGAVLEGGDRKPDKIGIDAPFGWPQHFTRVVAAYERSQKKNWPRDDDQGSECGWRPFGDGFGTTRFPHLRYRRTDEVVDKAMREQREKTKEQREKTKEQREKTKIPPLPLPQPLRPLSVSSDRIAVPAMRAAQLLRQVSECERVDRSGASGRFVEVYPAAALAVWELQYTGYKGTAKKHKYNRRHLVSELDTKVGLKLSELHRGLCERKDDALDALVAALVARAHAICECADIPPDPPEDLALLAKKEGWIALPRRGSLSRLV